MDKANLIVGISNVVVGILFVVLCIPLALEKVPPNDWFGVRLPKSMESDENWYLVNRYAAHAMLPWAGATIVVGVIAFFVELDGNIPLSMFASVFPVCIVIPLVRTYFWSRNL